MKANGQAYYENIVQYIVKIAATMCTVHVYSNSYTYSITRQLQSVRQLQSIYTFTKNSYAFEMTYRHTVYVCSIHRKITNIGPKIEIDKNK
jgi:hypothetical protein